MVRITLKTGKSIVVKGNAGTISKTLNVAKMKFTQFEKEEPMPGVKYSKEIWINVDSIDLIEAIE